MIRTEKPDPFTNHDSKRIGQALLVALYALAKHGDQEAIDQVTAVAEGRAKVEIKPG